MKQKIHPEYVDAVVKCACGAIYHTRSTKPEMHIEICSSCHPLFTGKQKTIDSTGRIEKFRKRYNRREK